MQLWRLIQRQSHQKMVSAKTRLAFTHQSCIRWSVWHYRFHRFAAYCFCSATAPDGKVRPASVWLTAPGLKGADMLGIFHARLSPFRLIRLAYSLETPAPRCATNILVKSNTGMPCVTCRRCGSDPNIDRQRHPSSAFILTENDKYCALSTITGNMEPSSNGLPAGRSDVY